MAKSTSLQSESGSPREPIHNVQLHVVRYRIADATGLRFPTKVSLDGRSPRFRSVSSWLQVQSIRMGEPAPMQQWTGRFGEPIHAPQFAMVHHRVADAARFRYSTKVSLHTIKWKSIFFSLNSRIINYWNLVYLVTIFIEINLAVPAHFLNIKVKARW